MTTALRSIQFGQDLHFLNKRDEDCFHYCVYNLEL